MNKTVKILFVLVLIAGAAWFFISRQGWSTLKKELKDFSVKDTASVTRFFLADRKGGKVLLQKQAGGSWLLNGKYPADEGKVNLVLATMYDVQVRNPVAENEFNQVVAFLASEGVKAEFYAGDKLLKTIYIGPSTPDQTGTFMMVEGSSTPFVTHIPGFVGYLTPRFITEEIKWRSKRVFDSDIKDIRSVHVSYPAHPEKSFSVINGLTPQLKDGSGADRAAEAKYLRYYLGSFRGLYFEGFEETVPRTRVDSIHASIPFCIVELKLADGTATKLQVHLKPIDRRTKQQSDEQGRKLPFDTEKYFAFLNDDPELLVIQEFTFNRVMKRLQDFTE